MGNAIEFVERMDSLRKEMGKSRKDVCDYAKISKNSFSNFKDRNNFPPADVALKLAEFFNVSVEWLVTGKEAQNGYTTEQRLLFDKIARLSPDDFLIVSDLVEVRYKRQKEAGKKVSG